MKRPALFLGLAIMVAFALTALSETNIDYSHDVVGTGTIMTDYKMTSAQSTEASGKVRGTGDVMNKYIFFASNNSENVTIEDQFTLSSATVTREITLSDYPQIPKRTPDFRLLGTDWARGLMISESEINKEGGKKMRALPARTRKNEHLMQGKESSILYEDEGSINGSSSGQKRLIVSSQAKDL